MRVDPNAEVAVTAFRWIPPFAAGLVRDLYIRWALEEMERALADRLAVFEQHQPEGAAA